MPPTRRSRTLAHRNDDGPPQGARETREGGEGDLATWPQNEWGMKEHRSSLWRTYRKTRHLASEASPKQRHQHRPSCPRTHAPPTGEGPKPQCRATPSQHRASYRVAPTVTPLASHRSATRGDGGHATARVGQSKRHGARRRAQARRGARGARIARSQAEQVRRHQSSAPLFHR